MYDKKNKNNKSKQIKKNSDETAVLYKTNALSQPDNRQYGTDVAIPDEYHVEEAREWSIENKK